MLVSNDVSDDVSMGVGPSALLRWLIIQSV
jgi:hypothetical protein